MDPQQEIFMAIRESLSEGYEVYDAGLPPEGTPYPFIHLGETVLNDGTTKSALFGNVSQTINFWSNDLKKRGSFSEMMRVAKKKCRNISRTKNFGWMVTNINETVLHDDTTSSTLLHGILIIEFRFS